MTRTLHLVLLFACLTASWAVQEDRVADGVRDEKAAVVPLKSVEVVAKVAALTIPSDGFLRDARHSVKRNSTPRPRPATTPRSRPSTRRKMGLEALAPKYPTKSTPRYPTKSTPRYPTKSTPKYPTKSTPRYPTTPKYPSKDQSFNIGGLYQGDRQLINKTVYKSSTVFITQKENLNFSSAATIHCIQVVDLRKNGKNAVVTVQSGGTGQRSVSLQFKSERGGEINYAVVIWGQ